MKNQIKAANSIRRLRNVLMQVKNEMTVRRSYGCRNLLGDHGRSLLASAYGDIYSRHPGSDRHVSLITQAVKSVLETL